MPVEGSGLTQRNRGYYLFSLTSCPTERDAAFRLQNRQALEERVFLGDITETIIVDASKQTRRARVRFDAIEQVAQQGIGI
jgi:hypothetical protein